MECIQHFSHEHPLSSFLVDDLEDPMPKPYKCYICGLPILSSPSYTCSINANCNFFMHKPCAQLPRELYYVGHRDILYLERPTQSPNHSYKCRNYSKCEFDLHPLVAKPVEIKSKHISHTSHPLVAICREIMCHCDGCGEQQNGFFFHCQECNFWIHQDCTILPTVVKLPNHPRAYVLSYSPPFNLLLETCSICKGPWRLTYNGVYLNGETYDMVHVACAKSEMENPETMQEVILDLPADEEDTFPSLVIRRYAEANPSIQTYHNHPLSREAACGGLEVCDACIQPIHISSPFYRCQSDGCDFVAHDICANHLPAGIQLFYGGVLQDEAVLGQELYSNKMLCSVFPCISCFRPTNGFVYSIAKKGKLRGCCDVECAFAPKIIKHASHRQHLLYQMIGMSRGPLSCCSDESFFLDVYRCVICDFLIHIKCALLPKRTRHKFDEHPLELITTNDGKQDLFCESCEQEIELKWWYYACYECEHYFHINCIPSVGRMSKVKFGKTQVVDNIHRNHPLTLTRMLTYGRHERCGLCNQIIRGFSDDQMALHCSDCDFWIHFSCAAATTELIDYSKFHQLFQQLTVASTIE